MNRARVVCVACDVALNRMVMEWAGFTGWRDAMRRYARRARRLSRLAA